MDLEGDLLEENPNPPLRGNGFYAAPVVRWLLETNEIAWHHLTHAAVATGRLPRDFFQPIVARLEEHAGRAGLSEKWAINSFWGVLATTNRWKYEHHASTSRVDLAHRCPRGFLSWSRCAGEPLAEIVTKEKV